jgi:hypothetical protein
MPLAMPLHRQLAVTWADTDRPQPAALAAALAAGLKSLGAGRVERTDTGVSFSDVPWTLGSWNPLSLAASGSVIVRPSSTGFTLDVDLDLQRLALTFLWGCLAGLLIGIIANDLTFAPWAILWLAGLGGATGLFMLAHRLPQTLARFVQPPLPPLLPSERRP